MITPDNAVTVGKVSGSAMLAATSFVTIGSLYDLTDIDMTAETLDERVRFSCDSARLYWAADGSLATAAANVWPLEYDQTTAKAVGRTPPEPQATNLQLYGQADILNSSYWTYGTSAVSTAGHQTGANGINFTEIIPTAKYSALYQESPDTTSHWLGLGTDVPTTAQWSREVFTFTGATIVRLYAARETSTSGTSGAYLYARTASLTAANTYTASLLRKAEASGDFLIGLVQVEAGSYATSPIPTSASGVTRAEAFAYVLTQYASGMTVTYSDGTTESFTFSGEYQYPLPNPSANWGARYITKISYTP